MKTEQTRLEEICQPLIELTGLKWRVQVIDRIVELRTDLPCRNQYQVDFIINTIFIEALNWQNSKEKQFYDVRHNEQERSWDIQIFPTLSVDDVRNVERVHRAQKVVHQQTRQSAPAVTSQLEKISGVKWTFSCDEKALFAPVILIAPRTIEKNDPIVNFTKQLNQFCKSSGYPSIELNKIRVHEEKSWQVKMDLLKPCLDDYYHHCLVSHQHMVYRARKVAQKLTQWIDNGIMIDVQEAKNFSDPIQLFFEGTSAQLHAFENIVNQYDITHDDIVRDGKCITLDVNRISLVGLERYGEYQAQQRQEHQVQIARNECQRLAQQLQSYITIENFHLRQELVQAVKQTEERLVDHVDQVGHKIMTSLAERLESFEVEITTKLKEYGLQFYAIETIVRQTQEHLLDINEKQEQTFERQQRWLDEKTQIMAQREKADNDEMRQRISAQETLSNEWQGQLKGWLEHQFKQQEQQLHAYMDKVGDAITPEMLEEQLHKFQEKFTDINLQELQKYQGTIEDYLNNHSQSLNQVYQEIQQSREQFEHLEKSLLQRFDDLSFHDPQETLEEVKALLQSTPLNIDWTVFHEHLEAAGSSVLGNASALKETMADFLTQVGDMNLQSRTMSYLTDKLLPKRHELSDFDSSDLNVFVSSFQIKAKQSLEALNKIGQNSDVKNDLLSRQIGDVAEMASDLFSVAIPGLRLLVKTAVFGTRKVVEFRQQSFADRIEVFLLNENVDELLADTARYFARCYRYQLIQLNMYGMETLINRYLLPCLLTEMANASGEKTLSTEQKKHRLRTSFQTRATFLPVKLTIQQPRKYPWTAAGLILGPLVVVDNRRYKRKDNPLHTLPWQPKPHRIYGERLGDEQEINSGKYELFSSGVDEITDRAVISWKDQTFTADYLMMCSDHWEEQDSSAGDTRWHVLARQKLLCDTLKRVLSLKEHHEKREELEEKLRSSLLLTNNKGQNVLHVYFISNNTMIEDLYQLLKRLALNSTANWDQQRDEAGFLPFEYLYQKWQKNPKQNESAQLLIQALSAWFRYSDLATLTPLTSTYPLPAILPNLQFSLPSTSPIFKLYQNDFKTYLLTLLKRNYLFDIDESGNTLLHCMVKNDDADFFESLSAQLSKHDLFEALSRKNSDGDTPIVLATKCRSKKILHAMIHEDRCAQHKESRWEIEKAKELASTMPELLTIFSYDKGKKIGFFSFVGFGRSASSDASRELRY